MMSIDIDLQRVLGHSDNTILMRFCETAINAYREPEREGVEKGNKIGFSFNKNAANVLMALTNIQTKLLSERSGMSYASMRTWNTQEDFRAAKENNCASFINFVRDEIKKNRTEVDIKDSYLYSECVRASLPQVLNIASGNLVWPDFNINVKAAAHSVLCKETLISEIERHKNILTQGVLRKREKEALRNLLEQVSAYINCKEG